MVEGIRWEEVEERKRRRRGREDGGRRVFRGPKMEVTMARRQEPPVQVGKEGGSSMVEN